jgi:uncharacterized delta-60 repeat protein
MTTVRFIGLFVFAIVVLAASPASARPGDADPSFSSDGFAQVDLTTKGEQGVTGTTYPVQLVGIGAGGEITLAATTFYSYDCVSIACARTDYFIAFARLLPNGDLDKSFAGDGTFETNFDLQGVRAGAYALQPDGKVLIAGSGYTPSDGAAPFKLVNFVARLNPDATLDEAFADGGIKTLGIDDAGIGALALEPDGRIIVGGSVRSGEFQPGFYGEDGLVVRLLSDGSFDPSFGGGDGISTFDLTRVDTVDRIAVDGLGRIFTAGRYDAGDDHEATGLARLLPDGSLDATISGDGWLPIDLLPKAPSRGGLSGLVVDGENRPVVSISSVANGPTTPILRVLLRYTESGSPDPAFGTNGQQSLSDVPDGFADAPSLLSGLALDAQGRLLVSGGRRGLVGRRLSDGSPDKSFGQSGWVQLDPLQGALANGYLLIDPVGRVLAAGGSGSGAPQVARLRTDTAPPDDLDADGVLDASDPCPSQYWPVSGCATSSRALTVSQRKGRFFGALSSPSAACVRGAEVQLLKKRRGRDRLLETSPRLSDPGGSLDESQPVWSSFWSFEKRRHRGRFYVRVRATFDAVAGDCSAARSRTIRLGPRRH